MMRSLLWQHLALAVCLALVVGCGDDEVATDAAAGGDGAVSIDSGPLSDGPAIDAPHSDAPLGPDASAFADAGGAGDDAAVFNLGPVDCRSDGDCPGISSCNSAAPGGICLGCGTDLDCPAVLSCGPVGACIRDCSSDADCSAGKRCGGTGRCIARTCNMSTPCPEPYICGANSQCRRPACPTNACPTPLTCSNAICVEP